MIIVILVRGMWRHMCRRIPISLGRETGQDSLAADVGGDDRRGNEGNGFIPVIRSEDE
jgi:hypothetical protein